jgi:hypothetical protein
MTLENFTFKVVGIHVGSPSRRAALGTGLATLFAPDGTGKTGQSAVEARSLLQQIWGFTSPDHYVK